MLRPKLDLPSFCVCHKCCPNEKGEACYPFLCWPVHCTSQPIDRNTVALARGQPLASGRSNQLGRSARRNTRAVLSLSLSLALRRNQKADCCCCCCWAHHSRASAAFCCAHVRTFCTVSDKTVSVYAASLRIRCRFPDGSMDRPLQFLRPTY